MLTYWLLIFYNFGGIPFSEISDKIFNYILGT